MVPDSSPERLERPLGTLLDALGAPLGRSWALTFSLIFSKIYKKTAKIVIFRALGLLLGVPQTIRHRFLTLRGSILTLRGMISRPSHRQTPSPNSSKVLAKSWRSPCENHNQHSVQPKRMNSKRWCGGLASAFSIIYHPAGPGGMRGAIKSAAPLRGVLDACHNSA